MTSGGRKWFASIKKVSILTALVFTSGCFSVQPEPIQFGKDQCDHCKMSIIDPRFGGEILTSKGKAYKFDAVECLVRFQRQHQHGDETVHVLSFEEKGKLIPAAQAAFRVDEQLRSPMGQGIIASAIIAEKSMKWSDLVQYLQIQ